MIKKDTVLSICKTYDRALTARVKADYALRLAEGRVLGAQTRCEKAREKARMARFAEMIAESAHKGILSNYQ